jgi:hypothetical protein
MISDTPPALRPTVERDLLPRVQSDGFLPDELLAGLIDHGQVEMRGGLLRTLDGRSYVTQPALRVLGPVLGAATDPFGLTGGVKTVAELLRQGFVVSPRRLSLGRMAYDVEHGVVVHALGSADDSGVTLALR